MDKTLETPMIVYTPESQLRSPGKFFRAMGRDLIRSRELAWRLFIRDVSAQYRQSMFGILWAFVPPIITSLIFIVLQSRNVVNFDNTDIPYPVFVLVGTILWQLFTDSLNAPLKSLTMAKPLLVKINFPREAVIVSSIYSVILNLVIKGVVLAVIFIIFRLELTWGVLLSFIPLMMLMLLGIGVGLILTPIGMLYTDIASSLPIITQLFFFVTPVVYPPLESYPFSLLAVINPVSPLLIAGRDLITKGFITNFTPFIIISGITVVLVMISWVMYRVAIPIIIERLSA